MTLKNIPTYLGGKPDLVIHESQETPTEEHETKKTEGHEQTMTLSDLYMSLWHVSSYLPSQ